jgi:hypothetical protein
MHRIRADPANAAAAEQSLQVTIAKARLYVPRESADGLPAR